MRLVGDRRVFTVEDVTARLSGMFEGLTSFWVEAEVQDLRPARAQMRFTLRGEHVLDASMNGIVFERLAHRPANGALVQAYGRIEFWRQRGQISMRVEKLELAGEGLLRARVDELRARLEAEGLLDPGAQAASADAAAADRAGHEPRRRRTRRRAHHALGAAFPPRTSSW